MTGLTADASTEAHIREHAMSPEISRPYQFKFGRLAVLVFCMAISVLWSNSFRAGDAKTGVGFMGDLREIYLGSRCVMHHQDPYDPQTVLKVFLDAGGKFPPKEGPLRQEALIVTTLQVNLPTTLFLLAPLALLSWGAVEVIGTLITAISFLVAGYLIWDLCGSTNPKLFGCLVGFVLANCVQLLAIGNIAGFVVSASLIATWCFLKNRWTAVGAVLFALCLLIKPHDVGFVWLYFVLAGGVPRKRALQALAITCVIGAAAAMWIAPASPHWYHELHENHTIVSQPGSTSDPSIAGITSGKVGAILDLQAALSVIIHNPRAYNLVSYLIAGPLLAIWLWITLRRRNTQEQTLLGLAAVAVLTLLPIYHRPYDAKMLMLAFPACAMLWRSAGLRRWVSIGLTAAGLLITCEIVQAILLVWTGVAPAGPESDAKSTAISVLPPVILLAMGCFFLWEYVRSRPTENASTTFVSEKDLALTSAS
ncbi:MAG: glycosyltransferase 87 family protein [Acidobacteriota bacterium]